MPFTKVTVWHCIKFMQMDPSTLMVSTSDSIHCRPERKDSHIKSIPSCFDTGLINNGTGEDIGLDGYHIGHIHIVFSIPEHTLPIVFTDSTKVPEHLAYVEWYTPLSDSPEPNHLLYKVSPQKDRDGTHICSIIPLANIHCSVHLYPKFGVFAPQEWSSSNVLDQCSTFFVNDSTDRHMYRIAC
ncbi:hypothetical protein BYT27DRAFT_7340301 [Phlegmacium glaucopus]|nr:hypothetical protein BYT27DRAFT_7340301 [Phlegmacium glaucopus]